MKVLLIVILLFSGCTQVYYSEPVKRSAKPNNKHVKKVQRLNDYSRYHLSGIHK